MSKNWFMEFHGGNRWDRTCLRRRRMMSSTVATVGIGRVKKEERFLGSFFPENSLGVVC